MLTSLRAPGTAVLPAHLSVLVIGARIKGCLPSYLRTPVRRLPQALQQVDTVATTHYPTAEQQQQ
jgi:hypothetical protein